MSRSTSSGKSPGVFAGDLRAEHKVGIESVRASAMQRVAPTPFSALLKRQAAL